MILLTTRKLGLQIWVLVAEDVHTFHSREGVITFLGGLQ